jgi:hypothetical protein
MGCNRLIGASKKPGYSSERDYAMYNKTFGYMADDIERKIAAGYEVVVYPFNDDIISKIDDFSSNTRETYRQKGIKWAEEHIGLINAQILSGGKNNIVLELGGCTNIGAATKKAEELFKDTEYNNIVILITDGFNEYPYYFVNTPYNKTKPLDPLKEGREALRECISKANRAAVKNNTTENRFIYVVFGNDNPYMDHDRNAEKQAVLDLELEKLYKDKKTKIIYPEESSIDIKFYDLSVEAVNLAKDGKRPFHMSARDGSFKLKIKGLSNNLKQDVKIRVTCYGDSLDKSCLKNGVFEKVYTAKDEVTVDGIVINQNSNENITFKVDVKIVEGDVYDSNNLYYAVFMNDTTIDVTATKQFYGQIKVRMRE